MSYKDVALALSPKGLWMFDEASGTTINDASGNAQNGTYSTVTLGATSLIPSPGGNGTAATFSGTSGQWLGSIPNSATIALTSFTVVMWFKFTGSTAFAVPVSMASEQAGSSGFELVRNNTATSSEERVDTPTSNNQLLAVGSTLFDGSTHMVAVGLTGSTAFQSVDAGTYITGAISGTYAAPAVDLFFGNSANHVSDPLSAVGTYQGAAMFSGQLTQAQLTRLYQAGLGWDVGSPVRPPPAVVIGNQPWQAAPPMLRQHNVVFRAANLPDPYRQSMPPVPAIQQGMAPWQAPPIKAQWNVVFRAANLADPYRHSMAPIPAWQAGMQQWWAPIAHVRTTNTDVNPSVLAVDQATPPLPFQAIQQTWWAPVPALHPTMVLFQGGTEYQARVSQLPLQAIGQPWWAPVWALHPTTAPFQGGTEYDSRPTGLPFAAIQQGWQLQYVRIPPYGPNDIGIVAIPVTATSGLPRAAIQQMSQFAPVAGISGAFGSVGPVVGPDPIVVWRHRAGMQ